MIIYRTPENLESLRNDPPIWATVGSEKIQNRLLAALLLRPAELMRCKAYRWPSALHRRIVSEVQQVGGDFSKWRSRQDEWRTEIVNVILKVSEFWELRDPSNEEVKAMAETVEFYWRMQQHCFRSLEQAAMAWKGKR